MNRERAEAHLRMLAEDEVRHAALPSRTVIRVARVARALTAVGALDDETAKRILDEVELARALRHPAWQASRPVT
jgi:1-deoxy-D-xylulose 5-phosphate reductoisomerase